MNGPVTGSILIGFARRLPILCGPPIVVAVVHFDFRLFQVRDERQFSIKYNSKKFIFINNDYFSSFLFNGHVVVNFHKWTEMDFLFGESETAVCCLSIDLVFVQLEIYYVDIFGYVAYREIVNIRGTVYSVVKAFNDAVNFYTKEGYRDDASLWDPFHLVDNFMYASKIFLSRCI